jgi:hypothetical protein
MIRDSSISTSTAVSFLQRGIASRKIREDARLIPQGE